MIQTFLTLSEKFPRPEPRTMAVSGMKSVFDRIISRSFYICFLDIFHGMPPLKKEKSVLVYHIFRYEKIKNKHKKPFYEKVVFRRKNIRKK